MLCQNDVKPPWIPGQALKTWPRRYSYFVFCFPGVTDKLLFVFISHAAFFILHLQVNLNSPTELACKWEEMRHCNYRLTTSGSPESQAIPSWQVVTIFVMGMTIHTRYLDKRSIVISQPRQVRAIYKEQNTIESHYVCAKSTLDGTLLYADLPQPFCLSNYRKDARERRNLDDTAGTPPNWCRSARSLISLETIQFIHMNPAKWFCISYQGTESRLEFLYNS